MITILGKALFIKARGKLCHSKDGSNGGCIRLVL